MEWDTVALLDDFVPDLSAVEISAQEQEERNLLYVAVTRAKRKFIINPACFYTLLAVGDRRERLVDTDTYIDQHGPIVNCVRLRCRQVLPGKCATRSTSLRTTPLQIMTSESSEMLVTVESGIFCALCAGLPYYNFPKYSGYDFSAKEVGLEKGHIAFRFLVGPTDEEMAGIATPFYANEKLSMQSGFIPAQHLMVAPQPPALDPELEDDDDDELMIQCMYNISLCFIYFTGFLSFYIKLFSVMARHDDSGVQQAADPEWPDDDDIFLNGNFF